MSLNLEILALKHYQQNKFLKLVKKPWILKIPNFTGNIYNLKLIFYPGSMTISFQILIYLLNFQYLNILHFTLICYYF